MFGVFSMKNKLKYIWYLYEHREMWGIDSILKRYYMPITFLTSCNKCKHEKETSHLFN